MSAPTFDLSTVPERDRDRVAALIPDPRIAEAYVHRNIGGFDDFDVFDAAVEERENVMLQGPTGSSKTTVFRAWASARRFPLAVVECNASMDIGTIIGRTTIGPDGVVEFIDGDLTLVVRYGGCGMLDEISLAHPRITAGFHGLLAVTRRMSVPENGETVVAGRGGLECGFDDDGVPFGDAQPTLFGAAHNPRYQGTVRLNEALANRFAITLDWDYDRNVERQLLDSERLLDLADNVRSLSEIRTPVSTNSLMEFERHAHRFNIEFASTLFVNRFSPEERGPVARALEASSAAIAAELSMSA